MNHTTNTKGETFYVGDVVTMWGGLEYTILYIREDGTWSSNVLDVEPNIYNDWIPDNLHLVERPSQVVETGWTL